MAPPKLTPGQPISFPAAEWNRHVEASDAYHRAKSLGEAGSPVKSRRDTNIVNAKNTSGADRRKGEILEFAGSPLTNFADGLIWLNGEQPALANGFGVLLAAAPSNKFEDCQVSGVCTALVNVTEVGHAYARPASGNAVLQSDDSGGHDPNCATDGSRDCVAGAANIAQGVTFRMTRVTPAATALPIWPLMAALPASPRPFH